MAKKLNESVFLNIPYDKEFEDLYLAYLTGLTMLGLVVKITSEAPNNNSRLDTIIKLIQASTYSIHDLSRISTVDGVPRFNMPLELGMALYHAKVGPEEHHVYIFEQESYRIQRSTSDLNGIDAFIHDGTPKKIMANLRSIFRREAEISKVPEMMRVFQELKRSLPTIKKNAGTDSLFEGAIFKDIVLALSL